MTTECPSSQWKDYQLVDSGNGEKLERFGPWYLRRPEPKALWDKTLSEADWQRMTHTHFRPGADFMRITLLNTLLLLVALFYGWPRTIVRHICGK